MQLGNKQQDLLVRPRTCFQEAATFGASQKFLNNFFASYYETLGGWMVCISHKKLWIGQGTARNAFLASLLVCDLVPYSVGMCLVSFVGFLVCFLYWFLLVFMMLCCFFVTVFGVFCFFFFLLIDLFLSSQGGIWLFRIGAIQWNLPGSGKYTCTGNRN